MTNEDLYSAIVALKEATETGFNRTDGHLDGIYMRLGRVESHVSRLETRLEGVQDGLARVEGGLASLAANVAALSKRRR